MLAVIASFLLMYAALLRLLLALLLIAPAGRAQSACDLGTARTDLDVNEVRAGLYNKGNLFYNGGDPNYEIPAGSGVASIFAASIWIGGLVDGDLRTAAATYAQGGEDYEFFPGPLDAAGGPPTDCAPYDRIWRVSKTDLARYEHSGLVSADLAEWPAHLGAPFFDVDGDGAYDLAAGDRPRIYGDQTAWWVMNDVAGPHRTTLSEPIGLEVRVTAFASAGPAEALRYTTFYRYELTYRGEAPLDSTYFTFFADPDLGNYNDDYIGSDTTRDLGFVYNADNDDELGLGGYGEAPPAQGLRWLDTPDDQGMTVFAYYNSNVDARMGNPSKKEDYWEFMRGFWRDGAPVRRGGDGTASSGTPTTFVYPNSGRPEDSRPGYWSEVCPQPSCDTQIQPDDRRFHTSTGPFRMDPGETEVVTFALVWARGADNFDSVQKMKAASDYVERAYHLGVLDPEPPLPAEPEPPPAGYGLGVAPNPFASEARVRLDVPEGAGPLRVAVFDVLGREVAVLAEGTLPSGEHALALGGAGLPAGLYLIRLEAERQTATVKAVRVE